MVNERAATPHTMAVARASRLAGASGFTPHVLWKRDAQRGRAASGLPTDHHGKEMGEPWNARLSATEDR